MPDGPSEDRLNEDGPSKLVVLPGSRRVAAPGAVALQPTDPNAEIDVTVKLRRKAPLPEIDPVRPQILSPEELARDYGASQEQMDLAARTLEGYGLKVTATDLAARSLHLSGTAAALGAAFGVSLFDFQTAGGAMQRGRSGALYVPAALAGVVEGVFGLDERRVARARPSARHHAGLYSGQLADLYQFPPGDGGGQTVALLEFGGGFFPADLAHFCRSAKVPVPAVRPVSVGGAATDARDGQEGEVMLDVEVVAGVCPQAAVSIYFSRFDEQGWIDALDRAVADRPTVISISWGLAEDDPQWSQGAIQAISDSLHQAALLGITACVASGDDGSSDQITDGLAHLDFPASSPYVLAVGGTSFTLAQNAIASETAWKQGDGRRADGGGSTGGGVSQTFARPAWQTASVPSVNPHPLDGRVAPDVAALSGTPYYYTVVDGKAGGAGGTSAAAPLWACLICRLAAGLPAGKRLPFLPPLLYQGPGAAGCHDVTTGDNVTATVGGYQARTGFDAVTGWGSPDGRKLLAALLPLLA